MSIITKVYYIQNSNELDDAINSISKNYPSAIHRNYIEMNYSCIEITARAIDIKSIEYILSPLF